MRGDYYSATSAIEGGADVNCRILRGSTPLHLASERGYKHIVGLLLDNNAVIDIKDRQGRTALVIAMENLKFYVVQVLVSRGADLHVGDNPKCRKRKRERADFYYIENFLFC